MDKEVAELVKNCIACQLAGTVFHRRDTIGGHLASNAPRTAWSLDCAPSIKGPQGQKQSVLVIVDDFSKFVLLKLVTHLSSKAVAQIFLSDVISTYGRPYRVRVDNGSEFLGEFSELMGALEISIIRTCPLTPWTNGIAERMIGVMNKLLRKSMVGVEKSEWPQLLSWI